MATAIFGERRGGGWYLGWLRDQLDSCHDVNPECDAIQNCEHYTGHTNFGRQGKKQGPQIHIFSVFVGHPKVFVDLSNGCLLVGGELHICASISHYRVLFHFTALTFPIMIYAHALV